MTLAYPRVDALPRQPTAAAIPSAPPRAAVNPITLGTFYLFVLSIPYEIPQRAIPVEVSTATGFLFLFATLLNPSACYGRILPAMRWFAVYLWMFVVSTVLNPGDHPGQVAKLFIAMAELLLIFWAGTNLMRDERIWRTTLRLFVLACVVRAALQVSGIATTEHTVWTGGERVTAFGQNTNLSAIIQAAGLMAVIGMRLGPLGWPIAAVQGLCLIQTGSRGGLLCAMTGALLYLFRGRSLSIKLRNALVGVLAMGLLAWGAFNSELMHNRFEQTAEEGTMAGRELIYPALLEMFSERPLLGWGPVNNQYEIARRIDERKRKSRDAHNLVLELLTTTGVIGAIPFLLGLGLTLKSTWRSRTGPFGVLPVALVAAVLVGTVSGTWIASKILWTALAFGHAAGDAAASRPPCAA